MKQGPSTENEINKNEEKEENEKYYQFTEEWRERFKRDEEYMKRHEQYLLDLLYDRMRIYEVPKEFRNGSAYVHAARARRAVRDKETPTERKLLEHMLLCDIIEAKKESEDKHRDLKTIHEEFFEMGGIMEAIALI